MLFMKLEKPVFFLKAVATFPLLPSSECLFGLVVTLSSRGVGGEDASIRGLVEGKVAD